MDKVVSTAAEAVAGITTGPPSRSVGWALRRSVRADRRPARHGVADLEVVSNNCGVDGWGLGDPAAVAAEIRRVVAFYVGENKEFARQYLGARSRSSSPRKGTLAERLRAGGVGHSGVLHSDGVGSRLRGRPARGVTAGRAASRCSSRSRRSASSSGRRREREYVLEQAIVTDYGAGARLPRATGTATSSSRSRPATSTRSPRWPVGSRSPRSTSSSSRASSTPITIHLPGIYVDRVVRADPRAGGRNCRSRSRTVSPAADAATAMRRGGLRDAADP